MLGCVQITVSTIVKLKKYMDIGRILMNSNTQNASLKDKMSWKSGEGTSWKSNSWKAAWKVCSGELHQSGIVTMNTLKACCTGLRKTVYAKRLMYMLALSRWLLPVLAECGKWSKEMKAKSSSVTQWKFTVTEFRKHWCGECCVGVYFNEAPPSPGAVAATIVPPSASPSPGSAPVSVETFVLPGTEPLVPIA